MGYRIQNLGWPDFLAMSDDGKIIAVEAKDSSLTVLTAPQKLALLCLARSGVPCFRWSPDEGLQQITESTPSDDDSWVRNRIQNWVTTEANEEDSVARLEWEGPRRWRLLQREIHIAAEKPYLLEALQKTGGNQWKASKLLGMSYRGFQYKLKEIRGSCLSDGAKESNSGKKGN
jgi:DNA-binding NtrC family response regulator